MTTSLWAEVTIAGFFYLLGIVFLVLRALGIYDISALAGLKDYVPIVSIVGIALSYILGILTHRLVPVIVYGLVKFTTAAMRMRAPVAWTQQRSEEYYASLVILYQEGSVRLLQELDYHFNLLALFRSLVVAVLLCGCSFAFWLTGTINALWSLAALVASVLISIGFCLVYFDESRRYEHLQHVALQKLSQEPSALKKN